MNKFSSNSTNMKSIVNNVRLTSLLKIDSDILFNWINNTELVKYNAVYKPVHELSHIEWLNNIIKDRTITIFGIRKLDENKLIGSCQLFDIHPVFRTAELQIRIGDQGYQSKGYGTIALRKLLEYGFKNANLRRIFLRVFADNIRAINAYKKVGFIVEGTLRQAAYIEGEYKDIIIMGILKDEFNR